MKKKPLVSYKYGQKQITFCQKNAKHKCGKDWKYTLFSEESLLNCIQNAENCIIQQEQFKTIKDSKQNNFRQLTEKLLGANKYVYQEILKENLLPSYKFIFTINSTLQSKKSFRS